MQRITSIHPLFLLPVLLGLFVQNSAGAQSISGVINQYAKVLVMDDCGDKFEVRSLLDQTSFAQHFAVDDKILLMQMKGAIVNLEDNALFGSIEEYSQAGYFEFAVIDAVSYEGTTTVSSQTWYLYEITVDAPLQHWYDPSQLVQMVSVPGYSGVVTVSGVLTADAWDPDHGIGGVLAFENSSSVTLSADIDVSGKGFKGGIASNNGLDSNLLGYVYSENINGSILKGGRKGEGIARIDEGKLTSYLLSDRVGGRGRGATGGGGGNARNAGGGGGANAGDGGRGGNQLVTAGSAENGGVGGRSYAYVTPLERVLMGSGGGGGHQDDDGDGGTTTAGAGGAGGGIVIIKASQIYGGGYTIKANGEAGSNGNGDGGGGGGSGGSVLLDVPAYVDMGSGFDLYVEAKGGDGGDAVGTTTACHGPGGGGGGGLVWFSVSSQPPRVKVNNDNTTTGAPGLIGGAGGGPTNCTDPDVDATNGAKGGAKGVMLFDLVIP